MPRLDWIPWPLDGLAYRWQEQHDPENTGFDDAHGTETSRFDWLGNYEPTRAGVVEEVLDAMALDWPRYSFVDLGSGKGRVVLIASRRPFRRVVGIEVSEAHHRTALDNVAAFGPTTAPVVLLNADVADEPLPEGSLALFLYNPFGPDVLARVLGRLRGRDAVVGYVHPVHAALLDAAGFTVAASGREGEIQHWRVYRRGDPGPSERRASRS